MSKIPFHASEPYQIVDLYEENRTGVYEIKSTEEWCVVYCCLKAYAEKLVTLRFSADVKRVGASGDLAWQINNRRYPTIGNQIKKAAADKWYKMSGEWTGTLTDSAPVFYLSTWKNNSERATYYIDNFNIEIILNPEVAKKKQKTLVDVAKYIKGLLPANIPEAYSIKPMFEKISDEKNIREGVVAFRDFLRLLCDRIVTDGSKYEKPAKESKSKSHPSFSATYPFMYNVKNVLISMGYHSKLSDDSMLLNDGKVLADTMNSWGEVLSAKISAPKLNECKKFLTSCGFAFDETDGVKITYPSNPAVIVGLKVMAVAQRELRLDDIFLRCDYRALKNEASDITDILNDFLSPLPAKTREFALNLHRKALDAGLNCSAKQGLQTMFTYSRGKKPVWEFAASVNSDYRIFVKPINLLEYSDVTESFAPPLKQIIARGFGCERQRLDEPCQKGCHGYSIPLDDSIIEISRDIETWISTELSYYK
jgi:hypothetical protein